MEGEKEEAWMGLGRIREQKDVRSKSGWNQGRRTGVKKKECTDGCLKDRSMEGLVDGMMNIMKEDRRIEEYQEHTVLATKQKSPENKKF